MSLSPFLKWVGGKRRHIKRLKPLLPKIFGTYYEPFLGSGAIFLSLQPDRWVVGDTNPALIQCWLDVKNKPEELMDELDRLIEDYDFTNDREAYYYAVRKSFNEKINSAMMIFLNSTCYNGVWRTNKKGAFNGSWNKDFFKPVFPTRENITRISAFLNKTEGKFVCGDWKTTLKGVSAGDLVFCDPPYLNCFAQYCKDGFDEKDHKELADRLKHLTGVKVIATNSNNARIRELYHGFHFQEIEISHNVSPNKEGRKCEKKEIVLWR